MYLFSLFIDTPSSLTIIILFTNPRTIQINKQIGYFNILNINILCRFFYSLDIKDPRLNL